MLTGNGSKAKNPANSVWRLAAPSPQRSQSDAGEGGRSDRHSSNDPDDLGTNRHFTWPHGDRSPREGLPGANPEIASG